MITGKTKLFAIVAHPVGHVQTPAAINALFHERGMDAVMVPFEVQPNNLTTFVTGLGAIENFGGLVVTVPHKTAIARLCDHLTERAAVAGAVNAIRRNPDGSLTGDLLDGAGFVAGLEAAGHRIAGRRVWLVGAGGAASAIAFAIAAKGPAQLTLVNRTPQKVAALAERLAAHHQDVSVSVGGALEDHDLVINATSLGLNADDPLPIEVERIVPGALVAEVIMQPEYTALLEAAKQRGLRVHSGRAMLDGQLSAIFAFLTGAETEITNAT